MSFSKGFTNKKITEKVAICFQPAFNFGTTDFKRPVVNKQHPEE